jgi:hypothetical protein
LSLAPEQREHDGVVGPRHVVVLDAGGAGLCENACGGRASGGDGSSGVRQGDEAMRVLSWADGVPVEQPVLARHRRGVRDAMRMQVRGGEPVDAAREAEEVAHAAVPGAAERGIVGRDDAEVRHAVVDARRPVRGVGSGNVGVLADALAANDVRPAGADASAGVSTLGDVGVRVGVEDVDSVVRRWRGPWQNSERRQL